jgi:hypothetical protein
MYFTKIGFSRWTHSVAEEMDHPSIPVSPWHLARLAK